MKEEEQIAENYLKGLGIGNVIFEPDGNIPPDFSVGRALGTGRFQSVTFQEKC